MLGISARRRLRQALAAWAVVGMLAVGAAGDDRAGGQRQTGLELSMAGSLTLPDSLGEEAAARPITGLSGITWLGEDRYAAVMDNSNRLLLLEIRLSAAGVPEAVDNLQIVELSARHDYEDLAVCPPRLVERIAERRRSRGDAVPAECLLVCEEDTPAIRAVDLESGELLGIVPIPDLLRQRRTNRGLESLAVDPDGETIWTATEEAIPADGPAAADGRGTVVRLTAIEVPGGAARTGPAQVAYAVDPPHRFARVFAGEPLAGLVALAALGDGRLLALERSAGPGLPPFTSRITLVETAFAKDVSDLAGGLADRGELHAAKHRLWEDAIGLNLEGLCLGPSLADGGRAVLTIADNGGLGTPNQLVGFVLRDPGQSVDAAAAAAAAAAVGSVLLLLRLTSPSPCSTR